MNEADILAKISIFSLMKKEDLERIAKLTRQHLFHAGDVIIREGDSDRRLFIIASGRVVVIKSLGDKNERRIRTLGANAYFGEMALIDEMVRSASVIASEETQILSLDHWDLRREIEEYPALAVELLRMLSQRIREIEKGMINLLGALLPICANCKNVRDANGSWVPVEKYISEHSQSEFSHGICPDCLKELYPQFYSED